MKKEEELKLPEKQKLVREASPMNLLTKDDPPTFLLYPSELSKTPLPPDTNVSISIHPPKFGVLLKEQLDQLGIANDLAYNDDGRTKVEQTLAIQAFLKKHLVK